MSENHTISRRSAIVGAAGVAATALAGGLRSPADAAAEAPDDRVAGRPPLWAQAKRAGIVFGSSIATWQLDEQYKKLHGREAGLLWPEDDLLWYQLKPTPDSK